MSSVPALPQPAKYRAPVTVIYHSADFDGLFCREIARWYFGEKAEYLGWNYGEPVPDVPETNRLFILDLSIEELMTHPRLVWIDHHKTAMEKYPANLDGYRIDGVAACRLAWQYFHSKDLTFLGGYAPPWDTLPKKEDYVNRKVWEPKAVRLAGEYDIWDKRDPDAEVFQFGLRSLELTEAVWAALLAEWNGENPPIVEDLLRAGDILQRYQRERDASAIKKLGFTVHWEGLTFLACNASMYNSHLFTAGILPEHEGLLGFNFDGKQFNISLYGVPGKPDVDLSAIAKKYGGGGHKQACGFRCAALPWGKEAKDLWIQQVFELWKKHLQPKNDKEEKSLREMAATMAEEECGYFLEGITPQEAVDEEISSA